MKKLLAVALMICLLLPVAHAESVNEFISAYMNLASSFSAPEISSGTLQNINGVNHWAFDSGVKLIVLTNARNQLSGVTILGNESNVGDFLAVAVCCVAAMDAEEDTDRISEYILTQYLDFRDHKKDYSHPLLTKKGKIAAMLDMSGNDYQFIIGHTGL